MTKVFLDAGHGGKDPGALGNGLKEKDITLPVTLKVGNILKEHGVTVGYSRTTDVFLELSDRAKKANSFGADIFVSIHCNAFNKSTAKGVETYSYPNSTKGAKLAKLIQDSVISEKLYTVNRGTKTANFAVLRETNMPAALIELAFITNSQDAEILKNKQDDLAVAVAKGILDYLGVKYKDMSNKLNLKINGKLRQVEGYLKNETSYIIIDNKSIPLKLVGEALGFKVSWDETNRAVVFND